MTTFAPATAAVPVQSPHDQQHQRAPVEYGAAVTHRDLVREKLRVDPAAIVHKKRAVRNARPDHLGKHVDLEA